MTDILSKEKTKRLVDYWWKLSQEDFKATQTIFKRSKRNVHALFFLHLSIEKALKACYVNIHGKQAPYSHQLFQLLELLDVDNEDAIHYKRFLTLTNRFNIETRYPSEKLALHKLATNSFVQNHIKQTDGFLKWLKKKFITNA